MENIFTKWKIMLAPVTFAVLFCCMNVKVLAADLPLLVDNASLLSESEAAELEEKLNQVSDEYGMDVAIFTEYNGSISSAMEAADDYFDNNGFGRGEEDSGLVLYVNTKTRDWWISTKGQAIDVFTDYGIQYIGDAFSVDLSVSRYYDAFHTYINLCDKFLEQAQNGEPYDVDNEVDEPFPFLTSLIISMVIGLVVATVYIMILKWQLKSVVPKDNAKDYIVNGSMRITTSKDTFLYKNVSKTVRQTSSSSSSSSSGGSRIHRSSSGSRHGGGGGKF